MTERRHVDKRTGQVIDNPPVRPFADFLRDQGQGKTHDELGEALWDLVQRVRDTGKKGTLSLILSVEPMKGDPDRMLLVSDEIRLKLPEFARPSSVFYATGDGNLSRSDPDQLTFDSLREVPQDTPTSPKEVRV